jgi:hypothetical protein
LSERSFDAFALPAGVAEAGEHLRGYDEPGLHVRCVDATPEWVAQVADALETSRESLRARRASGIAAVLGSVGARFADPGDPVRAESLALLPPTSGLSEEMAMAVLDGMAADWTAERLLGLLRAELGGESVLDGFAAPTDGGSPRMAVGPKLCVQIVAGSVPGVGVSALIRSLLLKGPTLLKPGRGDVALPVLFARALRDVDPVLADAVAVVYWPGGGTAVEAAALVRADVVTAYGSDETVQSLRARTPVTARFVGYHHRTSVGVIGREALSGEHIEATAADVAVATAMFDRRGCVSPQVVFVEGDADAFSSALAAALDSAEARWPSGPLESGEASALQQVRGTAELLAASGGGSVLHGGSAPWTVLVEPDGSSVQSCVGRTVSLRTIDDLSDVSRELEPLGPHLQTVGFAGLGERTEEVARALGDLGASRIVPFRAVAFPPPWWHHDGRGPLLELVRWVDLER